MITTVAILRHRVFLRVFIGGYTVIVGRFAWRVGGVHLKRLGSGFQLMSLVYRLLVVFGFWWGQFFIDSFANREYSVVVNLQFDTNDTIVSIHRLGDILNLPRSNFSVCLRKIRRKFIEGRDVESLGFVKRQNTTERKLVISFEDSLGNMLSEI